MSDNNLNEYFVVFYGDHTNVKEDIASFSEINPRFIVTGDIMMVTFKTILNIKEVSDFLKGGTRLYTIQRVDENLILNLTDKVNSHLMNNDPDYFIDQQIVANTNSYIELNDGEVADIDEETKSEIINLLLSKYPNISEGEKKILKKLTEGDDKQV